MNTQREQDRKDVQEVKPGDLSASDFFPPGIGWNQAGMRSAGIYPSHQLRSFFAVKVYGPVHVIAHNAIAYFHASDTGAHVHHLTRTIRERRTVGD